MAGIASYHRLKFLMAAALACYGLVAVCGDWFSVRKEYFPVFSWSLFSKVPERRFTFELYIHRVGDNVFSEPVIFYELGEHFPSARRRKPEISKAMKNLGRALKDDLASLETRRAVFEGLLLKHQKSVDYEIVRVVFRPLERWHSGQLDSVQSFGTFTAERR